MIENSSASASQNPAIGNRHHQQDQRAGHLFGVGRDPEPDQSQPDHEQPEHNEADRQGGQPGDEFSEQQRITINRLRQDTRQRAPVVLAVDRIEAEPDGDQRHQERQQCDRAAAVRRG